MVNSSVNPCVHKVFLTVTLSILLVLSAERSQPAVAQEPISLYGTVTLLWGDGPPGTDTAPVLKVMLIDETDQSIQLSLSDAVAGPFGGLLALDRKKVSVTGYWLATEDESPMFEVQSLQLEDQLELEAPVPESGLMDRATGPIVSGSRPWISILCKFADVSDEPRDLQYFQTMYSSFYPGLDHYWREQSYDAMDIAGSDAVGWFTLPHERAYYVSGSDLRRGDELADDCTAAADSAVYYPDYYGVNLMFNETLGCCAFGGARRPMTNDAGTPVLPMTWLPPWGFGDASVVAHEMGHGLGLPHSMGKDIVYNNPWDIMGDNRAYCHLSTDPSYGCLPQHTIAHHKDRLGWISPEQKYVASPGSMETITLERLAQPETGNYLLAQIPIGGSATNFYTLEVRQRVGYDVRVPGNALVIHHVNLFRHRAPAEVVDADGNTDTGDEGAMWHEGETFTDAANGISVSVESPTSSGFVATIAMNRPPVCDAAIPSIDTLWPPNHKFVPVRVLNVTDPDEDTLSITINSIYQDEPVNGGGSGHTGPDGRGLGAATAKLRAERAGSGNGRVYHIGFSADDAHGGRCTGHLRVGVPHHVKKSPVDDGALYDSTVP